MNRPLEMTIDSITEYFEKVRGTVPLDLEELKQTWLKFYQNSFTRDICAIQPSSEVQSFVYLKKSDDLLMSRVVHCQFYRVSEAPLAPEDLSLRLREVVEQAIFTKLTEDIEIQEVNNLADVDFTNCLVFAGRDCLQKYLTKSCDINLGLVGDINNNPIRYSPLLNPDEFFVVKNCLNQFEAALIFSPYLPLVACQSDAFPSTIGFSSVFGLQKGVTSLLSPLYKYSR